MPRSCPSGESTQASDEGPSSERLRTPAQIPYSRTMRNHLRRARGWLSMARDCWPRVRALAGWIGWSTVATAILAALILVPPLIAPELSDAQAQFEVRDRARLTVATIVGGLILLVGVWMNWRRVSALGETGRHSATRGDHRAVHQGDRSAGRGATRQRSCTRDPCRWNSLARANRPRVRG